MRTRLKIAGIALAAAVALCALPHPAAAGSWTALTSGVTDNLYAVSCPTTSVCYAVGDLGAIVKTLNGGNTWTSIYSGISATLKDIQCFDANNCVVAGGLLPTYGYSMVTTDGGTTWQPHTSSTFLFYGIDCPVNSTTCYGVGLTLPGMTGGIVKTTDGLVTWNPQTPASANTPFAIDCTDNNTCYVVGSSGTIEVTTNGGTTWTPQTSGVTGRLQGITCPAAGTCYAVGVGGVVLKTINGGSTWTSQTSGITDDISGPFCLDANTCYAAAGNTVGMIIYTTNGGSTWTQESGLSSLAPLWEVSCPSPSTCFAVGETGGIARLGAGGGGGSGIGISVTPMAWTQIAMPVTPDAGSLAGLVGSCDYFFDYNCYDFSYYYETFKWDPAAEDIPIFHKYRWPGLKVKAGEGMWVLSYYYTSVSISGTAVTSPYTYAVGQGWNQLGTPFNQNFNWPNIQVVKSGVTYSLDAAVSGGMIARWPFSYDSKANTWNMMTATDRMTVGKGFMAYAYQSGLSLIYDTSTGTPKIFSRIVRKPPEVMIKLSAKGRDSADPDNFLGMQTDSADQFDGEDIVEPPAGMGQSYTMLYFPHADWPVHAGRYALDMRGDKGTDAGCSMSTSSGVCKAWDVNLATNESGTTMTVSWGSLAAYAALYDITLTDLTTGAVVNMITTSQYTYATDGTEHRFKVQVVRKGSGPQTMTHTLLPGWNLIAVPVEPELTSALQQLGDDLKSMDVYQFFGGKFYTTADKDGVDIQAGVGYWVYVDAATEIDITGIPPSRATGVKTPLNAGWNLVGNPFDAVLPWNDDITLACGGITKQLSDAVTLGWTDGILYSREPGAGYGKTAPGGTLAPWRGYWLKVKAANCEIDLKSNQ